VSSVRKGNISGMDAVPEYVRRALDESERTIRFRSVSSVVLLLTLLILAPWFTAQAGGFEVRRLTKSCNNGNMSSCSKLGTRYTKGTSVARNDRLAVEWFRKACDGGYATGCSNLGYMFRHGRGVPRDENRAMDLYRKACDAGSTYGCANVGYMNRQGGGFGSSRRAVDSGARITPRKPSGDFTSTSGDGSSGELHGRQGARIIPRKQPRVPASRSDDGNNIGRSKLPDDLGDL